jgi:O-antigen/teichoic acid export membrane protein
LAKLKKSLFSNLIKSELLRNTSILISGTAVAQIIPIVLQPILRRYFSPEIFGAFSVYLSLIGILIVISSFKYELAIILPKKEKEAATIFFLTIFLNFIFNAALLIVILLFRSTILSFLNLSEKNAIYLFFVPLGTFLLSSYQSINYWLIRKKRFFPISVNKFVRRGFEGLAQVTFRFMNVLQGLIFGDLIGHVANIVSGIYQGKKTGLSFNLVSLFKIKYVLRKYSQYPKFNVIPSLMSACSFLLPAIFINKFYLSENAGFFDLSKLLLSVPLALIATSVSNVLLQRVSEKYRNNESFVIDLFPILTIVVILGLLEIVVITFLGIDLFKLIFGELWGYSGEISKLLVWSYAMNFIVASFSSIFISMNKIKLLSIWQLIYFVSILSLIFFKNLSFMDFLKVYVLIEVACYFIIMIFLVVLVHDYERKLKVR